MEKKCMDKKIMMFSFTKCRWHAIEVKYSARTDFNNKKEYDIFCSDTIMYV